MSLIILLLGIFVLGFFPIPKVIIDWITFVASSTLYVTFLLKYKINFGKYDTKLFVMGIVCIIWLYFRLFYPNELLNVFGLAFLYGFYIYGQKIMTGKVNITMVIVGCLITGTSLLNVFFTNKIITNIITIIEIGILLKIVDPYMRAIAMKRREKLNANGFTDSDAKKVPLIRRILFGRTGKLDWSIIEMITGKDFKFKKEKTIE